MGQLFHNNTFSDSVCCHTGYFGHFILYNMCSKRTLYNSKHRQLGQGSRCFSCQLGQQTPLSPTLSQFCHRCSVTHCNLPPVTDPCPRWSHPLFWCRLAIFEAAWWTNFSKMLRTDHHGSLLGFRGRVMHQTVGCTSAHHHGDSPFGDGAGIYLSYSSHTLSVLLSHSLSHFFFLFLLFLVLLYSFLFISPSYTLTYRCHCFHIFVFFCCFLPHPTAEI